MPRCMYGDVKTGRVVSSPRSTQRSCPCCDRFRKIFLTSINQTGTSWDSLLRWAFIPDTNVAKPRRFFENWACAWALALPFPLPLGLLASGPVSRFCLWAKALRVDLAKCFEQSKNLLFSRFAVVFEFLGNPENIKQNVTFKKVNGGPDNRPMWSGQKSFHANQGP